MPEPAHRSGMFTDLYELTMAASYFAEGMNDSATFELFVRRLPETRNFLIAAGIDDALDTLLGLCFDHEGIDYLRSLKMFEEDFLAFLRELRFSGEAWAVREGEVVFAGEPLMRVTAPRIEAQILETTLINTAGFQTMVASKAARVALARQGRPFVDFSARRDHGEEAALLAARASYIAGAQGTSNVAAGERFGIPLSGTMAHSYVMSFTSEADAFRAYARNFPERAVLLLDTYDTLAGARTAVQVASELEAEGIHIAGVRLDSGDLGQLAREVRAILDAGGLTDVQIVASGDLDEHRVAALLAEGAPIDAFGVGTRMGTSDDAPSLSMVYKLVKDARGPKLKRSPEKATIPGAKQVWRRHEGGVAAADVVSLADESIAGCEPLLQPAIERGRRVRERESLEAARQRCSRSLESLPPPLRSLEQARPGYEVRLSKRLRQLAARQP